MGMPLVHYLTVTPLRSAIIWAGHRMLHHAVEGVILLDCPEALSEVMVGDLVFTSGYVFSDLDSLIRRAAQLQVSGVVVRTGRYIGEVSSSVRSTADSLGIPLIGLPPQMGLRSAMDAVTQERFSQSFGHLSLRNSVLEDFLQQLLLGADEQNLLQRLADFTSNHTTFESSGVHLWSEPVPLGFKAEHFPRVDSQTARIIETESRPQRVPPGDSSPARLTVSVKAGDRLLGLLSLWETTRPNAWQEELALRQVAMVLAAVFLRREAVQEVYIQQRSEAINSLLNGDGSPATLKTSRYLTALSRKPEHHVVVVISVNPWCQADNGSAKGWSAAELSRVLRSVEGLFHTPHSTAIGGLRDRHVLLIVSFGPADLWRELQNQCRELPRVLAEFCSSKEQPVVGVGTVKNRSAEIGLSSREAREALRTASQLMLPGPVIFFEQLGLYRLLGQVARQEDAWEVAQSLISPLISYDQQNNTNLLQTVVKFVEYGGNSRHAAEMLYIHPNTLQYRLNRVRSLTGLDWRQANDFFTLQLAVRIWHLGTDDD